MEHRSSYAKQLAACLAIIFAAAAMAFFSPAAVRVVIALLALPLTAMAISSLTGGTDATSIRS